MRLLLLSALLPLLSSPVLGQTTATYRVGLAPSPGPPQQQRAPRSCTLRPRLRPLALECKFLASDSADRGVWRRFRMGAAAGFAGGAVVGLVVQAQANQRETDGVDFPPLVTALILGIPAGVIGGAIAARWPR
jgi:hypothetical protein